MCPNCILNQAGLQPGLYVAFAICGIFFVAGIAAMWWAFRNGEFEDIESSKFEMLDEDGGTELAERAKAAVTKLREERARAAGATIEAAIPGDGSL